MQNGFFYYLQLICIPYCVYSVHSFLIFYFIEFFSSTCVKIYNEVIKMIMRPKSIFRMRLILYLNYFTASSSKPRNQNLTRCKPKHRQKKLSNVV